MKSPSPNVPPVDQVIAAGPGNIVPVADGYTTDVDEIEAAIYSLNLLRQPIPPEQVEKLPRAMWKGAWDGKAKGRCAECGGYHVLENALHLDYFGHARTTGRLLDADLFYDWEPLSVDSSGLPLFDRDGGLWIKLTVCGVTRLGYGHANGRTGGDAVKEIIGDALRNAAMRFGVALELWSKGEAHDAKSPPRNAAERPDRGVRNDQQGRRAPARAANQDALDDLIAVCNDEGLSLRHVAERFAREHDGEPIESASVPVIAAFTQKVVTECAAGPSEPAGESEPPAGGDDPVAGRGEPETRPEGEEPADLGGAGPGQGEAQDGPLF